MAITQDNLNNLNDTTAVMVTTKAIGQLMYNLQEYSKNITSDAIGELDVSTTSASNSTTAYYLSQIKQTNGKIIATAVAVEQSYNSSGVKPVSGKSIGEALKTLDSSATAAIGKYISSISIIDGKIDSIGETGLSPSLTLTDGTNDNAPKIKTTVAGQGSSDITLTVAATNKYGVTKLSSNTASDAENLAATPKAIKAIKDDMADQISTLQTSIVNNLTPKINNAYHQILEIKIPADSTAANATTVNWCYYPQTTTTGQWMYPAISAAPTSYTAVPSTSATIYEAKPSGYTDGKDVFYGKYNSSTANAWHYLIPSGYEAIPTTATIYSSLPARPTTAEMTGYVANKIIEGTSYFYKPVWTVSNTLTNQKPVTYCKGIEIQRESINDEEKTWYYQTISTSIPDNTSLVISPKSGLIDWPIWSDYSIRSTTSTTTNITFVADSSPAKSTTAIILILNKNV